MTKRSLGDVKRSLGDAKSSLGAQSVQTTHLAQLTQLLVRLASTTSVRVRTRGACVSPLGELKLPVRVSFDPPQ